MWLAAAWYLTNQKCLKVDREPVAITVLDDIAASRGLTAYEAAYLELTLRRGLSLATLDDALIAAMSKAGVPAASPGS